MSSIITVTSRVIDDLRGRAIKVINPDRLYDLFNECQKRIAEEIECVDCEYSTPLTGYTVIPGQTAAASTTSTLVKADNTDLEQDDDDYYQGWLLTNTTRNASAIVTLYTPGESTASIYLDRPIANQAENDTFKLEKLSNKVVLPWYLIRPYQKKGGVWWGTYPVLPGIFHNIEISNRNRHTGTPREWTHRNNEIVFSPMPVEDKWVTIQGTRLTPECFVIAASSNGGSSGETIISTDIPFQQDNYYVGASIKIIDGDCKGEVNIISHYDASENKLYFESPFSAQIVSDVNFELLCMLPVTFEKTIEYYLKWRIYERSDDPILKRLAIENMNLYVADMEKADEMNRRKNTSRAYFGKKTVRMPGASYALYDADS